MINSKIVIKLDIFKVLLICLVVICIGINLLLLESNAVIELDKECITKLETLTANVQRVSKLELEYSSDDELIKQTDAICAEILPDDSDGRQCFDEDLEMKEIVCSMVDDWEEFKVIVSEYRKTENRDTLFLASEENYNLSGVRIKELSVYLNEHIKETDSIQKILIVDIICIGLVLVVILLRTHKELQSNKKLSEGMYIDTSTGIYNRAKCQEIMKIPPLSNDSQMDRAVIIFDLNDLKKTNDNLGHRAGDQLIYDFAQQVKNATDAFDYEIFVGRYGGDEFVAFIDNIKEQDVKNYLDEVNHLMSRFNETENTGYRLSCAAGYGITTDSTKTMTIKELFDIADDDMYKNKIAMKEKKKQELIAQGIEVVEEVDDRL